MEANKQTNKFFDSCHLQLAVSAAQARAVAGSSGNIYVMHVMLSYMAYLKFILPRRPPVVINYLNEK